MTCFFVTDIASRVSVKMSCQLADALAASGVHCVMATPDGTAPQWFRSSVAFAAEGPALSRVSAADTVVVSSPRDAQRLTGLPARLVFHAQGTAPVLTDPSITVLACWPATAASVRQRTGRDAIEVGIAVDDVFFRAGVRRVAGTVAFAPHVSAGRANQCAAVPQVTIVPIDAVDDRGVAAILQASEFALVPEGDGGSGIEILEALAAGCIVVRKTRTGGALGLLDGVHCVGADDHELCDVLRQWSTAAAGLRRAAVRDRGRALAAAYRMAALRRRVAALLAGQLAFVRS